MTKIPVLFSYYSTQNVLEQQQSRLQRKKKQENLIYLERFVLVYVCKNAPRTKESLGLFLTVLSINSTLNFKRRVGGVGKLVGFCFFHATRLPLEKEGEITAKLSIRRNDNPYDFFVYPFSQKASMEKICAPEGCEFMLSVKVQNFVQALRFFPLRPSVLAKIKEPSRFFAKTSIYRRKIAMVMALEQRQSNQRRLVFHNFLLQIHTKR